MSLLVDDHAMTGNPTNNQDSAGMKGLAGRVGPKGVARLLGITLDFRDAREDNSNERIVELLQARLAGTWLADKAGEGAWSKLVRQLLHKEGSDGQRSIGGLLLDSQAPLGTIKLIRDRAKAQVANESREAEHAVMTMIYFAAIANALAYRRVKITTYSYESLESSFETLVCKAWIPAEFVDLFRRAAKVCQEEHSPLGSRQDGSLPQS
jgi:hypothetical protein